MLPSSPNIILKSTEQSDLADKFAKLYCDLIPKLYNIQCLKFQNDVRTTLKDMRRLKSKIIKHVDEFYIDIKYVESSVRCAYMYDYSILNTVTVYFEFSKYLKDYMWEISSLFLKKKIKICCLAGGPAFEAVAISKAIYDFCCKFYINTDFFINIEITVVDIVSEWETEGKALISALNESTNLFPTKRIHFDYIFLKADLLTPFDEILNNTIAASHIVTIVKFGSSLKEKSVSNLEFMIQYVTWFMTENSCLFMLDVNRRKVFRHIMDIVSNKENIHPLITSLHKKYRLLPKTVQKIQAYITFPNVAEAIALYPTVLTTVSSCFWIKKERI